MIPSNIPADRSRFRPRMDSDVLSRLIQNAWAAHHAATLPETEMAEVGDRLARHLDGMFPLADMRVLATYGLAQSIDRVSVAIHNGRDWSETVDHPLSRKVPVAQGFHLLYCGGPRYGGDTPEERGIRPEHWNTLTEGEKAKLVADQDAMMRRRVPECLEAHFQRILDLRVAFREEYAQSSAWPSEIRQDTGAYPTWGDMAERWPILGAHLKQMWQAGSASAAA